MKNQDKTQIMLDESPDVAKSIDESRRSFSKKGLIAPVILTLANRSAWGANACIGSGFQSYAAAKADGRVISHAAVNSETNTGWKKPRKSLPNTSSDGWYEGYQSWPGELKAAIKEGNKWKVHINGTTWTDPKNKNQIAAQFPNAIIFVNQLGQGFTNTNSIYDVLGGTYGGNLLAYQVATEINKSYVDNSSTPFPDLITIEDFRLFYRECIS